MLRIRIRGKRRGKGKKKIQGKDARNQCQSFSRIIDKYYVASSIPSSISVERIMYHT